MNPCHQLFITQMLLHGDKARAYKAAYPAAKEERSILSAANRLLSRPEISDAINGARNRIRTEAEQELKEQLKTEMLSVERAKELLTEIAEGRLLTEKQVRQKDGSYETMMVAPTLGERMRAITIYLRMTGQLSAKPQPAAEEKKFDGYRIFIDGKPFPKGPGYDPVTEEPLRPTPVIASDSEATSRNTTTSTPVITQSNHPTTPVIARSNGQPGSIAATKQSHETPEVSTQQSSIDKHSLREIALSQANTQSRAIAPRNDEREKELAELQAALLSSDPFIRRCARERIANAKRRA